MLINARRAAERALVADPFCEPAHRLLVRVHLAGGNPSAARAAFEACRSMLSELGVTTSATTEWFDSLVAPDRQRPR